MTTAVHHDLRRAPSRWVEQRASDDAPVPVTEDETGPRKRWLVWHWLARWWDGLPEVDKTILTGAGILSVPLAAAVTYCVARLLAMG